MLRMKFFRSYYPTAGLKNNPNYLTKEKAETLCMGNAETLTNQTLKQSDIELIIDNLFEKINRNTIASELPPGDSALRHGTSCIAWIYNQLHRLEGGSHFKNEMEYWNNKLLLHKDKDSSLTRHFNEGDNIFGILEGLAGMMLLTKSLKKEALKQ